MKNNVSFINKKVNYDYEIIRLEIAGVILQPSEVIIIKSGKLSMVDSFCYLKDNELFVKNLNVPENKKHHFHNPLRDKKLLLKRKEINKLQKELINGLTIVPYKVYITDRGLIKVEIALVKGKKTYDKREAIKEKDIKMQISRELK
jgi:SsrA-binding protein